MITNNEPRTKLEILPSPSPVFTVFRFSTVYRSLPFRVQMEIWFIEEGSRRLAPWKIRNTAGGGRRGIAVEKRPLPTINWMEFTGTGEIAYTAFEKAILRFGLESGGNVRGLIILFFLARVRQCGENGIKEEIGWVMLCRSFFFFVSCLYILLIIIPEEREIVSLSTRRMRIFFLRPRGSISQFCVKLILFI